MQPKHKEWLEKFLILAAVVGPFVGLIWVIILIWNQLFAWQELVTLATFYCLTVVGVGVGYHRMLTHRSFEASAPVRFALLSMGAMSLQGGPVTWASTHAKHHRFSDREGDPHSPWDGFWVAHLFWLFLGRFVGDGVFAKPYRADRVASFIERTFGLWVVLSFVLPGLLNLALGGGFWLGVLWGGTARICLVHHVTWSVNSVCHTFGRRDFNAPDGSRNQAVVGILGFGEGWHNNHHAFPKSARHGLHPWQIDLNWLVIRALQALRLAKKVDLPSTEEMAARRVQG